MTMDDTTRELIADLTYVELYAKRLGEKVRSGILDKSDAALAVRMMELASKVLGVVNVKTGPW